MEDIEVIPSISIAELHACSLSGVEFSDQLKLIFNRRIMARSYQSGELE